MVNAEKHIKVGIIGATGYTGVELIRLLEAHPNTEITYASSETYAGQSINTVYPHLRNISLTLEKLNLKTIEKSCDLVFIALPHGHAITIAENLINQGIKVIDLGADFRLKDPNAYTEWYEATPANDDLLKQSLYGLPETNTPDAYKDIMLVANPGCYPTAAILGAAPLLAKNLITLNHIVLDGKSGVSGAGRSLALGTHYCEVTENFKAYKVGGTHRHTPEIEQQLSLLGSETVLTNFTPHLVPMARGLFMTGYYQLKDSTSTEQVRDSFKKYYENAPFVRILAENQLPETAQVKGSNFCDIRINFNKRTQTIIITSVIDNLIKGASGQAIQNMNLLYQLDEKIGLMGLSTYP